MTVIPADRTLARQYFPHRPFLVRHDHTGDPRLALPALLALARELPTDRVEYNLGDLAVNQDPGAIPGNALSVEDTLLRIGECRSWLVMKNIERSAQYSALLQESLAALDAVIRLVFPRVSGLEGFLFVSSPGSVTPFHIDPEHNFLFQIRGTKTIHIFDRDDRDVLSERQIEASCFGAHRNLPYRDEFEPRGQTFTLGPGDGLYFPVRAPHWVQNGSDVSVSYSFTFRSSASERERKAAFVNALLRRGGLAPRPVGAGRDRAKVAIFDALAVPLALAKRSPAVRAFLLDRV